MRLAILLGQLAAGGAERQFLNLARGLRDRGHELHFYTLLGGGELAGELRTTGIAHRVLMSDRSKRTWVRTPRRLRQFLHVDQPDLLYSALYLTNLVAALAIRGSSIPLVWGVRNSCPHGGWKAQLPFRLGARLRSRVDLAISNSEIGLRNHRDFGYLPNRACVIPNGIDVLRFQALPDDPRRQVRRAWGVRSEEIVIGHVGRYSPQKNHRLLLQAWIDAARGDPRLRFVCLTPKLDCAPAELAALAAHPSLKGRLNWIAAGGNVERYYGALDLMCSASNIEGWPNVLGEAMASAVPCVATDAGDSAAVVGNKGWIVPVGAREALSRAILDYARLDAETRQRLGRLARERIVAEFSIERLVDRSEQALMGVTHQEMHV